MNMVEEWYVAEKCPHCYKDVENHFRCSLHKGVRVNENLKEIQLCPIRNAFSNKKRYIDLLKFINSQNLLNTYIGDI